jgi:hypothetical protein
MYPGILSARPWYGLRADSVLSLNGLGVVTHRWMRRIASANETQLFRQRCQSGQPNVNAWRNQPARTEPSGTNDDEADQV